MNELSLIRLAGRSALLNGLFFLASTITIVIYFSVGGFWGKLNDAISVVYALSFIPIALFFYRQHAPLGRPLNGIMTVVGIAAMSIFGAAQLLLTFDVVRFEQTIGLILLLGAVIGGWLLVEAGLARGGGVLPPRLIWLMIVYGASLLISAPLWGTLGEMHPLTMVMFLAGAVAGPIWAIWLGLLLNGRVLTFAS